MFLLNFTVMQLSSPCPRPWITFPIPSALMLQLQNPSICCHPIADPKAELWDLPLLRYMGRSYLNYISSSCSWVRWFEAKDYELLLPPCQQQSRDSCQHTGGKGWWRSVNVPALQDKCDYSQRQIWGNHCPSLPLKPGQCSALPRVACLRWLWLHWAKFCLWFPVFII